MKRDFGQNRRLGGISDLLSDLLSGRGNRRSSLFDNTPPSDKGNPLNDLDGRVIEIDLGNPGGYEQLADALSGINGGNPFDMSGTRNREPSLMQILAASERSKLLGEAVDVFPPRSEKCPFGHDHEHVTSATVLTAPDGLTSTTTKVATEIEMSPLGPLCIEAKKVSTTTLKSPEPKGRQPFTSPSRKFCVCGQCP